MEYPSDTADVQPETPVEPEEDGDETEEVDENGLSEIDLEADVESESLGLDEIDELLADGEEVDDPWLGAPPDGYTYRPEEEPQEQSLAQGFSLNSLLLGAVTQTVSIT